MSRVTNLYESRYLFNKTIAFVFNLSPFCWLHKMSRQCNNCTEPPPPSPVKYQTNPCCLVSWAQAGLSGAPSRPVVACLKDGFNFIPTQTFYATFFYVKKVRVTGVSAYRERENITRSEGSPRELAKNKANIILLQRTPSCCLPINIVRGKCWMFKGGSPGFEKRSRSKVCREPEASKTNAEQFPRQISEVSRCGGRWCSRTGNRPQSQALFSLGCKIPRELFPPGLWAVTAWLWLWHQPIIGLHPRTRPGWILIFLDRRNGGKLAKF